LGVQHPLYALDDVVAMGEKEVEKLDVSLKRHGVLYVGPGAS
jgi:hypothetical protein